jgi:DNA-binding transcriptional regulator YiaG
MDEAKADRQDQGVDRMSTNEESLGQKVAQALREMVAIERGEKQPTRVHYRVMTGPNADLTSPPFYSGRRVRQIRDKMGISQERFAKVMNCRVGTVKAWEEDLREPNGASRRLLDLADHHPEALLAMIARSALEKEDAPAEEPKLRRAG